MGGLKDEEADNVTSLHLDAYQKPLLKVSSRLKYTITVTEPDF